VLFANWSERPPAVFRLGIREGIRCAGCCWGLMLVMLAVGLMNLLWMALLALFTLLVKSSKGSGLARVGGAILLVWAFLVLLISNYG
jgi:predicted metal-binding membrane protein